MSLLGTGGFFIPSGSEGIFDRSGYIYGFWGILSGFIAYSMSLLATAYFDIAIATFFGAFCVGVYANVYARVLKSPAIIVSLQGLVILVPGSKVYIGLNSVVSGENMLGTEQIGTQAFLIFMSHRHTI